MTENQFNPILNLSLKYRVKKMRLFVYCYQQSLTAHW